MFAWRILHRAQGDMYKDVHYNIACHGNGWINVWSAYTVEYYTALKKNELDLLENKDNFWIPCSELTVPLL